MVRDSREIELHAAASKRVLPSQIPGAQLCNQTRREHRDLQRACSATRISNLDRRRSILPWRCAALIKPRESCSCGGTIIDNPAHDSPDPGIHDVD